MLRVVAQLRVRSAGEAVTVGCHRLFEQPAIARSPLGQERVSEVEPRPPTTVRRQFAVVEGLTIRRRGGVIPLAEVSRGQIERDLPGIVRPAEGLLPTADRLVEVARPNASAPRADSPPRPARAPDEQHRQRFGAILVSREAKPRATGMRIQLSTHNTNAPSRNTPRTGDRIGDGVVSISADGVFHFSCNIGPSASVPFAASNDSPPVLVAMTSSGSGRTRLFTTRSS